jgi:D-alanyl-D-alanine carboxypeptidase (penicillin-binding protein 5/6)
VLAACCAVGAATVGGSPAAAATPVGGPVMGTTATQIPRGAALIPTSVKSRAFVVADLTSGAVYSVRRPHYKLAPASTLKTLTALTILRNVPLDKTVRYNAAIPKPECACVNMVRGKYYRVGDLLNALIMRSGNDVAELLATSTGSRARTMTLMNNTLRDLRAADSRAVTPSGLDGRGQSMSAYDLALVNRAAFADARFRRIMALRSFQFGYVGGSKRTLVAQNELWHLGYRGELGSKNGWTTRAQQTFVAVARRGDRTLVVTLLYNDTGIAKQAAQLLDWGFALKPGTGAIGTLVEPRSKPVAKWIAPKAASAPTPASPLPVQTSLSLGAVGLAGLALLPGRRPGDRNVTRRTRTAGRGSSTR